MAAEAPSKRGRILSLALCGFESHEEGAKDAAVHTVNFVDFSAGGALISMHDKT